MHFPAYPVADEAKLLEALRSKEAALKAHAEDLERKIRELGGLPKVSRP